MTCCARTRVLPPQIAKCAQPPQRPRRVGGRCGGCAHFAICGGNTRVRAQQVTGDPWAEDPGCYLDDDEIGLQSAHERAGPPQAPYRSAQREGADERVAVEPFAGSRRVAAAAGSALRRMTISSQEQGS